MHTVLFLLPTWASQTPHRRTTKPTTTTRLLQLSYKCVCRFYNQKVWLTSEVQKLSKSRKTTFRSSQYSSAKAKLKTGIKEEKEAKKKN